MTSFTLTPVHRLPRPSSHVTSFLNTRWHQCTLLQCKVSQKKQQRVSVDGCSTAGGAQWPCHLIWAERGEPVWQVDFLWPAAHAWYLPGMKWTPSSCCKTGRATQRTRHSLGILFLYLRSAKKQPPDPRLSAVWTLKLGIHPNTESHLSNHWCHTSLCLTWYRQTRTSDASVLL